MRLTMARGLPKEKYEHVLICQEARNPLLKSLVQEGWTVHEIGLAPNILNLGWHLRAIRIARRFRPDIVHGAVFEGSALAVSIGIFLPKCKTVIEEQSDGRNRKPLGTLLMRVLSTFANLTVAVAPEIYAYLEDSVRVRRAKLRLVVNCARDPEKPREHVSKSLSRRELGFSENDVVIGSVGRLDNEHKRFSDLLDALPPLVQLNPRCRILIVGDGPDRAALESQCSDLGIRHLVHFAGFHSDVHRYLEVMDIFALVSAGEALPLALVEAMKAGLPCVATAVGGNSFALDGGNVGLLIPPRAPLELQEALRHLSGSKAIRDDLGSRSQRRAENLFSTQSYVEAIEHLWGELA